MTRMVQAGGDDAQMVRMMAELGIDEREILAAENAPDREEAMRALAQQMLARSLGDGGTAAPQSKSDERVANAAAALDEQRQQMERMRAEVEKHTRESQEAAAQLARARSELEAVEAEKAVAGDKVDASVEGARADMAKQVEVEKEKHELRKGVVEDFKAKGNLAMQRGDHVAARAFYSEALEIPEVPEQVRAALFGNRTACYLALKELDLALADAEEAVELVPGWVKGHFRLGSVRESLGDLEGAGAAFRHALELDPDNGEVAARLASLEQSVGVEAAKEKDAAAPAEEAAKEKDAAEPKAKDAAPATGTSAVGSFDERKAAADMAFRENKLERAIEAYSALLEERADDVALLSCRSACHLKAGNLADVEEDVDAALGFRDAGGTSTIPPRTQLKLLLRRADARLRSGRPRAAKADVLAAEKFVSNEQEAKALTHMQEQLAANVRVV